ncbi:DUF4233 domain-containing protein [Nocardia cyriacigeorgica]|uniref:DUF4233 domain-containing protein n=1 Tax=Nocardia cyriacigeorgica TaxID=135487 RepID=A0A6P1D3P5_9NOCA|nr:DUF4233 domain-containing protein [Nocardia cyriacigeorgica]NEW40616.1 DUF4233 domain-containing protein [Nocardia cyriacigeorgica]NEW45087.1 DUF4233 domain-containing protein [Nocardia cyriacigeorgica]NEW51156.1 DUF4233 domain-containing protein [Nocardia cyriacigeorgica]NEW54259.1 DUF4233 domain-containing protein [Nocardia cyriacigeorgica]
MSESDPRPDDDPAATAEQAGAETAPAPPDPWKGLRGVMAGTLVLEAIVVLLALPVVADVGGGVSWLSGTYLVALAVVMVLGAGLQRKPWALPFNLGLQALVIAGALIHISIGVIGILFAIVWAFILILRNDVQRRMDLGVLPSQRTRPPS